MLELNKGNIEKEIENKSIIEAIDFFKNQFEISEENIEDLRKLRTPNQIVPLLFLLNKACCEEYPAKYEHSITTIISKQKESLTESIGLFLEELHATKKFEEGTAKELIKELAEGLVFYSKEGSEWLIEGMIEFIGKTENEYFDMIVVEVAEEELHFLNYTPFLEIFQKSKSIYARKNALKNLIRIAEEGDIAFDSANIEIINAIKEGLEDNSFEIRWETSKAVDKWLKDLEYYKLTEEELEKKDINVKQIRNKLYEITHEFSKRVIDHFEREGTEEEKRMIEDWREKREKKEGNKNN